MAKNDTEELLSEAHKEISRAGVLVVVMLEKRRLMPSYITEIQNLLKQAQDKIGVLNGRTKN